MTTTPLVGRPADVWRLPVLYAASYIALGSLLPYLALELAGGGVTGWQFSLCLGALPLGRLLAGPVWGLIADRTRAPAATLKVAAALAPPTVVALIWALDARQGTVVVVACLAYALVSAPVGPIMDALALASKPGGPAAYGALRRWGSFGYLVGSLLGGVLLAQLGLSPVWLVLGGTMAVALTSLGLAERTDLRSEPLGPALRVFASDRVLVGILVAGGLHFSAHVAASSFLSVHMAALGLSTQWTGIALAAGVVVEIVVMSASQRLLGRFGAAVLLQGALVIAIFRWIGMTQVTSGAAMVALQATHGITFGAFWLASVALVDARAPASVRSSGQAVLSAAVAGAGALVGMVGGSMVVSATDTWMLFAVAVVMAVLATVVALGSLSAGRLRSTP